jgi:hypothetical protein
VEEEVEWKAQGRKLLLPLGEGKLKSSFVNLIYNKRK